MTPIAKMCRSCHRLLLLDAFSPNLTGRFGVLARCKSCLARAKRERTATDPEFAQRLKEQVQKWQQTPAGKEYVRRYRDANRERLREYSRKYRRPGQHRTDAYYRRVYGISMVDYERMLDEQGGVCALCHEPEKVTRCGTVRVLAVDHDHDTGRVRGLLCSICNLMLARVELWGIEAAQRYLAVPDFVEKV